MDSLTWLHVSDLHFGHGKSAHTRFDQELVTSQIITDARELADRLGPPNLIVITGDIAFSADGKKEYPKARRWIMDLLDAVGGKADQVLMVPGNHDVARKKAAANIAVKALHGHLRRTPRNVDDLLGEKKSRRDLWAKFQPYAKFANGFGSPALSADKPYWTSERVTDLGTIQIVGLNTSLLSYDDEDARKNLAVGRTQLIDAVYKRPKDDLLIVLQHHPTGWLVDGDELAPLLVDRPHLMCGHVRDQGGFVVLPLSGGGLLHFVAGAGHGDVGEAGEHAYAWGRLHCEGLDYLPRSWAKKQSCFLRASLKAEWKDDMLCYARHRLPEPLQAWLAGPKRPQPAPTTGLPQKPHREQILPGDPWREQNVAFMLKVGHVYRAQHAEEKFECLRYAFVVQANCLLEANEPGYGGPDIVKSTTVFQPIDNPVYCVSCSVISDREFRSLESRKWSVSDAEGTMVETIDLPALNPEFPTQRALVLFFQPVLRPGGGSREPYTLSFEDLVEDSMRGLRMGEDDEIGAFFHRAKGTVGRGDLVLFVPERLRDLEMSRGSAGPGRPMNAAELKEYQPPTGFRALGWTGSNLDPANPFVARVTLGTHGTASE